MKLSFFAFRFLVLRSLAVVVFAGSLVFMPCVLQGRETGSSDNSDNSGGSHVPQLELTGRTPQGQGARGEFFTFSMKAPRMYPGTERTIKVYVPAEYTDREPACVAIMMDDIMYGLAQSIDTLIAAGQMPVTIAVGVRPGRIYADSFSASAGVQQSSGAVQRTSAGVQQSSGAVQQASAGVQQQPMAANAGGGLREVIRYNRSNEFDRCDGRFAAFLAEEVLPAVSSFSTADGVPIFLSSRPEDRMVLGASSGGIAAFTAAWFRPDLFSRVYSIIGTFVPMRGGDHYPGVIRKTEPRPLRIYLQDNDEDTWNPLFGSWFEYNLLMESALRFAGYELEHHWDKGGHNGKNGGAVMTEALRFLWEDYPSPVKKGKSGNATLNSIVDSSSVWTLVASNVPAGLFIRSAGAVGNGYVGGNGNGGGLAMGAVKGVSDAGIDKHAVDGSFAIGARNERASVNVAGRIGDVAVTGPSVEGQIELGGIVGSPEINVGIAGPSVEGQIELGGIAVPQLLRVGENGFDPYVAVYPGGKHRAVANVNSQWVSSELIAPCIGTGEGPGVADSANAQCLRNEVVPSDESMKRSDVAGSCDDAGELVVGNNGSGLAAAVECGAGIDVDEFAAGIGYGVYRQEFYKLHTNGGQICFDTQGYLYCATEIGVQICDHNGRVRVILPSPCGSAVSSVGLVGNVLYVIAGGNLYARKIQRSGFSNALSVSSPDSDGQG